MWPLTSVLFTSGHKWLKDCKLNQWKKWFLKTFVFQIHLCMDWPLEYVNECNQEKCIMNEFKWFRRVHYFVLKTASPSTNNNSFTRVDGHYIPVSPCSWAFCCMNSLKSGTPSVSSALCLFLRSSLVSFAWPSLRRFSLVTLKSSDSSISLSVSGISDSWKMGSKFTFSTRHKKRVIWTAFIEIFSTLQSWKISEVNTVYLVQ